MQALLPQTIYSVGFVRVQESFRVAASWAMLNLPHVVRWLRLPLGHTLLLRTQDMFLTTSYPDIGKEVIRRMELDCHADTRPMGFVETSCVSRGFALHEQGPSMAVAMAVAIIASRTGCRLKVRQCRPQPHACGG